VESTDDSFVGGLKVAQGLVPERAPAHTGQGPAPASPIFRVFSMDSRHNGSDGDGGDDTPHLYLYSRSIDLIYETIMSAVRSQRSAAFEARGLRSSFVPRKSSYSSPSYGMNALQFFGLALPVVRQAIEMIPESCAAVIAPPPAPQYRPCYVLPSRVRFYSATALLLCTSQMLVSLTIFCIYCFLSSCPPTGSRISHPQGSIGHIRTAESQCQWMREGRRSGSRREVERAARAACGADSGESRGR
jgi:hypothetical protein